MLRNSAASMALSTGMRPSAAIVQIVDQRPIPELHRRVHPRDVRTQLIETRVVEFHAIDQDAAGCGAMPAEQQSNQARFAGSRRADDRDMRSGRDGQVDVAEHLMSRGDDAHVFKSDRDGNAPPAVQARRLSGARCSNAPSGSSNRSVTLRYEGYCQAMIATSWPSAGRFSAQ